MIATSATWAAGGSWGPNGVILYGSHGAMSILSASAEGGELGSVTNYPNQGQLAHFHPLLPAGRHSLPVLRRGFARGAWHLCGLARLEALGFELPGLKELVSVFVPDKRLVDAEAGGVHAMGRLFFVQGGVLLAQPFDARTRSLSGTPQVVARNIANGGRNGAALSATGDRVIYRSGTAGSTQQLTWFQPLRPQTGHGG